MSILIPAAAPRLVPIAQAAPSARSYQPVPLSGSGSVVLARPVQPVIPVVRQQSHAYATSPLSVRAAPSPVLQQVAPQLLPAAGYASRTRSPGPAARRVCRESVGRTAVLLCGGPRQPDYEVEPDLHQHEEPMGAVSMSEEPSMALLNMVAGFDQERPVEKLPARRILSGEPRITDNFPSEHAPDTEPSCPTTATEGAGGWAVSEVERLREELAEERRRTAQLESMYLAALVSRDDRQNGHARDVAMLEDMLRKLTIENRRLEGLLAERGFAPRVEEHVPDYDIGQPCDELAETRRWAAAAEAPVRAGVGADCLNELSGRVVLLHTPY
eukprot:TRINITY_DN7216_c0_g1_i3.p1 TRINITY_DN7216_c0_g1~~TRINITY_DN7216_c0_g1_i3.p1  ORF type:complete len:328 (-),score=56.34 TRINITY_DN7216_c0_g1_i3:194-1177(-)